jgi:hypothetical protein
MWTNKDQGAAEQGRGSVEGAAVGPPPASCPACCTQPRINVHVAVRCNKDNWPGPNIAMAHQHTAVVMLQVLTQSLPSCAALLGAPTAALQHVSTSSAQPSAVLGAAKGACSIRCSHLQAGASAQPDAPLQALPCTTSAGALVPRSTVPC